MKKTGQLLLTALCLAALLLTGCKSAGPVPSEQETRPVEQESTTPIDTDTGDTTENTLPEDTTLALPGSDSTDLALGGTGRLRIAYTGNRSGVRYVTDPSQLPDNPEFADYDEAFFQERALVLVTETVTSGSAKVEIQSITVENGTAVVTLSHEMPTGLGTADMATWLLWAEVEAGQDYTWILANPALKPQNENNERY